MYWIGRHLEAQIRPTRKGSIEQSEGHLRQYGEYPNIHLIYVDSSTESPEFVPDRELGYKFLNTRSTRLRIPVQF